MKKKEATIEQEQAVEVVEKPQEQVVEKDIPPYISEILKAFSEHETLFVNSKGGVFTSPHGDATQYINPHYNK